MLCKNTGIHEEIHLRHGVRRLLPSSGRSFLPLRIPEGFQKFFRRHCIAAILLNDFDYLLFLDADSGIINPAR